MELLDDGTDGVSFWANPDQGSGYFRLRKATANTVLKNFGLDFGYRIYYTFIIDSLQKGKQPEIPVDPIVDETILVPNPNQGSFTILTANLTGVYELEIMDAIGRVVYKKSVDIDLDPDIKIDNLRVSSGIYFVKLNQGNNKIVRRLIIE